MARAIRVNDIFLASAAFGSGDKVKQLPDHPGIYAYMHTDQAIDPRIAATWTSVIVPDAPRRDLGDRLRSQYFKHQIHRSDQLGMHRWLAWADASLYFFELDFVREWADRLRDEPPHRRALFIPHPQRQTITEEHDFILEQIAANNEYVKRRYAAPAMRAQMDWLARSGYNLDARIYCGGFWMVERSSAMCSLLDRWWDQTIRFGDGAIDQLALGALLDRAGVEPHLLEVDLFHNQHFAFVAHAHG
jgi:hypothetical protein